MMRKKYGIGLMSILLLISMITGCSSSAKVKPTYIKKYPLESSVEVGIETGIDVENQTKNVEVEIKDNQWSYGQTAKTYILNDMENLNEWVPRKLGDITYDLKNFRYGTKGIKITSVNNAVAWAGYTFPKPVDLYQKVVTFSVFINDITSQDTLSFIFFNGAKSFSAPMKSDAPIYRDLQTGWNTISLNPEQW